MRKAKDRDESNFDKSCQREWSIDWRDPLRCSRIETLCQEKRDSNNKWLRSIHSITGRSITVESSRRASTNSKATKVSKLRKVPRRRICSRSRILRTSAWLRSRKWACKTSTESMFYWTIVKREIRRWLLNESTARWQDPVSDLLSCGRYKSLAMKQNKYSKTWRPWTRNWKILRNSKRRGKKNTSTSSTNDFHSWPLLQQ